jgi:hypothetical protein
MFQMFPFPGPGMHQAASAGITADNTGQTTTGTDGATSDTLSNFVMGSGSNGIQVVRVSFRAGGGALLTGVTFGGVALTLVGELIDGGCNNDAVDIWRLLSPTASTADIVVSFTGGTNPTGVVINARSWFGVNQTTPFGAFSSNSGYGTSPTASVAITSVSGDLVLDCLNGNNNTGTATVGGIQAQDFNTNYSNSAIAAGSHLTASGTSSTMSWNISSTSGVCWAQGGAAMKAY